ncbi:MAG: SRPBCC domain-containing protein, partial [Woeseia sp.]
FWDSSWDTRGMAAGNAYRMISANGKTVAVIGQILEMDPPHRLVHSFQLTALDDPASTVTYTLKETQGGTEFCLVTENVVAGSKSEKSMADGSRFIVKNFKSYVETGKVTFGARLMLAMFRLMAPFTPKSMSADKWPLDR